MTNDLTLTPELLQTVQGIAMRAGERIMEVYNRAGEMVVEQKADDSPLTAADMAAHREIEAGLRDLLADTPVLSEESGLPDWSVRREWPRYWLVDPLDGTKEFVGRNGEFTVNIALIDRHRPVMGVVHVPVTGVTYLGGVGLGASLSDANGCREIAVRSIAEVEALGTPVTVVASRRHRGAELDAWLERIEGRFQAVATASMGSSLKICLVAAGEADLYPRLAPTSEWDTAAAHAVLEAAGGTLLTADFVPLEYNASEDILNPFFVAIGDPQFDWQGVVKGPQ